MDTRIIGTVHFILLIKLWKDKKRITDIKYEGITSFPFKFVA